MNITLKFSAAEMRTLLRAEAGRLLGRVNNLTVTGVHLSDYGESTVELSTAAPEEVEP